MCKWRKTKLFSNEIEPIETLYQNAVEAATYIFLQSNLFGIRQWVRQGGANKRKGKNNYPLKCKVLLLWRIHRTYWAHNNEFIYTYQVGVSVCIIRRYEKSNFYFCRAFVFHGGEIRAMLSALNGWAYKAKLLLLPISVQTSIAIISVTRTQFSFNCDNRWPSVVNMNP